MEKNKAISCKLIKQALEKNVEKIDCYEQKDYTTIDVDIAPSITKELGSDDVAGAFAIFTKPNEYFASGEVVLPYNDDYDVPDPYTEPDKLRSYLVKKEGCTVGEIHHHDTSGHYHMRCTDKSKTNLLKKLDNIFAMALDEWANVAGVD